MDMIAMLNGLGVAAPSASTINKATFTQSVANKAAAAIPPVMFTTGTGATTKTVAPPAVKAEAKAAVETAAQAAQRAADDFKKLADAVLLSYAQAAMAGQAFGDNSAEKVKALAPQVYAEVVARFGPGKLAEVAGYRSAEAAAAMVQAATAKQAEEFKKRVSPVMIGVGALALGALAGWYFGRR